MTRLAIMQAGAPSPVVNASVAGFLHQAAALGEAQIVGVKRGANGLAEHDFSVLHADRQDLSSVAAAPGALLGAGRRAPDEDELASSVRYLHEAGVSGLAVTGGNGSMALAHALVSAAARLDVELQVVGIPKTVDNDLMCTDRAPGYLSAGRYALRAVQALGADLRAMAPLEQVRLVEVLGRGVGWIAMAAALARKDDDEPPHLVYTPEAPLTLDGYLAAVDDAVRRRGHALVVVAEGAVPELSGTEFEVGQPHRLLRNGVVRELAQHTTDKLGLHTRAEVLGMVQRSASWMSPARDREDAWAAGSHAARLLESGETGQMVTLEPVDDPQGPSRCSTVRLTDVAGHTRALPFTLPAGSPDVPDEFRAWWELLVPDDADARSGRPTRPRSRQPRSTR